ncbi:hypothetical protein B0H17DRAFT_1214524 [Mycena rosella]|uniref:Uncharacterized protein n=1 Tax=Mycena rosella TaxID=1033263 RepID=A0AAD7CMS4_MYCRO|nr:hypothetical protein B0H17DRAFT_1214524 [Mycena rosella]
MVSTRSNRASSPTPSDSSDMYWDEVDRVSASPAPSETADAIDWDSDSSAGPLESANATPTPAARLSSPATNNEDDPFLAADIERAKAESLGMPASHDPATDGASSSRRPEAEPGSPSKRLRANTSATTGAPAVRTSTAPTTPADTVAPAPAAIPATAANTALANAPAPMLAPAPAVGATYAVAAAAAPIAAAVPIAAAAAPAAAVGPALPPLWLTADGLPPRGSFTPTPAGGFHPIVYSPEALLHGVPPDLTVMYDDVAQPKFFVVVSGGNGAVMRTHGLIREALGDFSNIDPTSFTLCTLPTAANGTSPALWLVADIPPQLAQAIVDNRIISSIRITLFPLPYSMPIIGFVGVFAGFTLPNTDAGAIVARDLIRTAIAANNEIAQFVQTHRDAFGPQTSAEQAWTMFLASVAVHGIVLRVNDTNTVAWRLYVDPSTNDRNFWGQCRRLFGKLQIMTALYGTARLQRAFRCHICPSTDHPTPLCPLPNTPGWLGPTPATITALEEASRAAAAKAQEQMRDTFATAGGSGPGSGNGRAQGGPGKKPRGDGKGKKGGDYKGKGKRRERNDFF